MQRYKVRIFTKEGGYGIVALDNLENQSLVGMFDGRFNKGKLTGFQDYWEALDKYDEAIERTLERDWILVYSGDRNQG